MKTKIFIYSMSTIGYFMIAFWILASMVKAFIDTLPCYFHTLEQFLEALDQCVDAEVPRGEDGIVVGLQRVGKLLGASYRDSDALTIEWLRNFFRAFNDMPSLAAAFIRQRLHSVRLQTPAAH